VGIIVTKCPVTGRELQTGIETDAESFARIASIVGRVWCPYCKTDHDWAAKQAYLRDRETGSKDPAA
jgi:hypothetical protein